MKPIMILKALLMGALFITACDPSKKTKDSVEQAMESNDEAIQDRGEEKDADFVVKTMADNYAEIEIAKLAQKRSKDQEVISLAREIETDHEAILGELRTYATEKGIVVPISETHEQWEELNQLAEKDPDHFDQKLCEVLMDNHNQAVNEFESRVDKVDDPELKMWISKTLPTLKSHLEMIKAHDEKEKAS